VCCCPRNPQPAQSTDCAGPAEPDAPYGRAYDAALAISKDNWTAQNWLFGRSLRVY